MKPITPQHSVTTLAAEQIRTAILDGSLAPGTRVLQEDLATKLGVSREPVRQALVILEREGLVTSVLNRGATVAPLDPSFISEIYEFRETIEPYVAGKVARQIEYDATPLRRIVAQGRKAVLAGALDRLIDLDWSFHTQLYGASGNRVVIEVMQTQWSHIRRVMVMTLKARSYRERVWDEHEAILEAIVGHKVARAQALAAAHARGAREFLTAGLQASAPVERGAK